MRGLRSVKTGNTENVGGQFGFPGLSGFLNPSVRLRIAPGCKVYKVFPGNHFHSIFMVMAAVEFTVATLAKLRQFCHYEQRPNYYVGVPERGLSPLLQSVGIQTQENKKEQGKTHKTGSSITEKGQWDANGGQYPNNHSDVDEIMDQED